MTVTPNIHPGHHSDKKLEAYTSMGLAILLTVAGGIFFFRYGEWDPGENKFWYFLLAWIVLGYLALQLISLLSTAIDTTSIGFADMLFAIAPAFVGGIAGFEALQGIVHLSRFSENALMLMICTSALESLITLWVRFTVNRKTTVFDTST